ncbi:sigma-70 family RNA polymerase sigma factor [Chitinophaga nivalis]|uniref:RNA polymerase sigma factor n=1 Tax=Chitinophaga nivalis TaxID=2991709 RepID=A0ABT3IR31_9BACT|nr:sigma-70 family RNA polymerase sigma factor [Chitinophaga nivalis]MCW3463888.1 sigma-70 family RNA polymerase sigma factor [Chitinophaga nivalis]MCW3486422.1 sigma-70 family RNA polymerase sigma factor [Chitinophaga nivalis]
MPVNESDSAQEATTGNPATWVKQYAADLFRFALSQTADRELAQDLVQDTFLSALQARAQFRGESSELTWLMSILRNKVADHYRTSGRTVSLDEQLITDSDPHHFFFNEKGHWHKHRAPVAWTKDIPAPGEQSDFFRVLQACMKKLTGIGQAVFNQKYLDEKKSTAICKDLAISTSNYWVIMHRARLQLRACLGKNWFSN